MEAAHANDAAPRYAYGVVVIHAFGSQTFLFRTAADRDAYVTTYRIPGAFALIDPDDWKEAP
jgi:hypothetical protein